MYGGERTGSYEKYTGTMYEMDCIGQARVDAAFKDRWDNLKRTSDGRLERYEDLYDLVRAAQPGDPADPQKSFARDVRLAIADELGLEGTATDNLKFYTAVGTPLDFLNGVDGFFEVSDPESGRRYRVTMDLTLNGDKVKTGHKADIIVGEIHDVSMSEEAYLKDIEDYGNRIAMLIKDKKEAESTAGNGRNVWRRDKAA